MFANADGSPLPTALQARLRPQPEDCYKDANIAENDTCHQCRDQRMLLEQKQPIDIDKLCVFRGFRATIPDLRAGESYATRAFWNEPCISEDQAVDVKQKHVHTVKDGVNRLASCPLTVYSRPYAANEMARGITPMLEEELLHAGQLARTPLQRRFEKEARTTCDSCECALIGSWICSRCGSEICLTCFKYLNEHPMLSGVVKRDSVFSCKLRKVLGPPPDDTDADQNHPVATLNEQFSVHKSKDFFPVARVSKAQLEYDLLMVRVIGESTQQTADTFVKSYVATAMYEKGLCALKEKGDTQNFWVQTREELQRTGKKTDKVAVIRMSKKESEESRVRRVTEACLLATEPFVLEQDVTEPLSDEQLKKIIPPETKVKLKIQMKKAETWEVVDWTWSTVVKRLVASDKSSPVEWLDIRDFPKHGALQDLEGGATDMFARATACPGSIAFHALGSASTIAQIQVLGDVASWVNLERRDAQEKFYVALRNWHEDDGDTTSLHVDEAGAANVAVWAKLSDEEKKGGEKPAVAEWLVWRPEARQHILGTVTRCLLEGHTQAMGSRFGGEHWDGDEPLYGQKLTATDKFVDALVAEGGEICRPRIIRQRLGDVVFILPGFPHQVRNLRPCVKIAKDFMPASGIGQMLQVQIERARACSSAAIGRDACVIRLTLYQAWRALLSQLLFDDASKPDRPLTTMAAMADATGRALERQAEQSREVMAHCREAEARMEALKKELHKLVTGKDALEQAGNALLAASRAMR
ncbi:hypothetical protein OC845_006058 [Tilletia horrida]|nr:hypothetical protein OC845_006058 [Tilletia horrida]